MLKCEVFFSMSRLDSLRDGTRTTKHVHRLIVDVRQENKMTEKNEERTQTEETRTTVEKERKRLLVF